MGQCEVIGLQQLKVRLTPSQLLFVLCLILAFPQTHERAGQGTPPVLNMWKDRELPKIEPYYFLHWDRCSDWNWNIFGSVVQSEQLVLVKQKGKISLFHKILPLGFFP